MYNLLIVDDVYVNRRIIQTVLQHSFDDLVFFMAENGNQALEVIENHDIDLVILDLMMPEKDGFEVLIELKSKFEYRELPVIVNSALSDTGSIQKALSCGAVDYFSKPLTRDEMDVILPLKVKNAIKYYEQTKILRFINQQMQDDLRVAGLLQNKLVAPAKKFKAAEIYGSFYPSNQIGGDFYDCIENGGNRIWFIIADVAGHGVAAAIAASMLKILFNESVPHLASPKAVLEHFNQTFQNIQEDNLIILSAFVGLIEAGVLTYANAGHPYPFLYRKQFQKVEFLEENGFLIGAFKDVTYEDKQVPVAAGDTVIAYTDGLFDNYLEETQNSWPYIPRQVTEHTDLLEQDPEKFLNLLTENKRLNHFQCIDDVAVMLIKIN